MSLRKRGSFHHDHEFFEIGNSPSRFESSSEEDEQVFRDVIPFTPAIESSPRFESPDTQLTKSSNFNSTLNKKSHNPYLLMINSKLANNA